MVYGFTLSIIGGGLQLYAGLYEWPILVKLVTGGVVGVLAGAKLSSMIPSRPLRLLLSVWLAILGLQLCWKAFG